MRQLLSDPGLVSDSEALLEYEAALALSLPKCSPHVNSEAIFSLRSSSEGTSQSTTVECKGVSAVPAALLLVSLAPYQPHLQVHSDIYYGHEETAKICARFVTHVFSCPDPNTSPPSSTRSFAETPSLAQFVAYALHRTRLHSSVTFTALALLHRLKARFPAARGSSGHRLFLSSFMIASKVICDDTYSNKSWAVVGQNMFALREINQMEREMCQYLEWRLNIVPEELTVFQQQVTKFYSHPPPYSHSTAMLGSSLRDSYLTISSTLAPISPTTEVDIVSGSLPIKPSVPSLPVKVPAASYPSPPSTPPSPMAKLVKIAPAPAPVQTSSSSSSSSASSSSPPLSPLATMASTRQEAVAPATIETASLRRKLSHVPSVGADLRQDGLSTYESREMVRSHTHTGETTSSWVSRPRHTSSAMGRCCDSATLGSHTYCKAPTAGAVVAHKLFNVCKVYTVPVEW